MMPKTPDNPSSDWRETRRLYAWELHEQGLSQSEIASEVGVSQGAVSLWLKQVREAGDLDALRRHPAPGKQALLNEEQFAQLPELMARGAEAYGFQGDHWTTSRVALVIKQVFGVSYHPGHVSRILQKYHPGWRKQRKT